MVLRLSTRESISDGWRSRSRRCSGEVVAVNTEEGDEVADEEVVEEEEEEEEVEEEEGEEENVEDTVEEGGGCVREGRRSRALIDSARDGRRCAAYVWLRAVRVAAAVLAASVVRGACKGGRSAVAVLLAPVTTATDSVAAVMTASMAATRASRLSRQTRAVQPIVRPVSLSLLVHYCSGCC